MTFEKIFQISLNTSIQLAFAGVCTVSIYNPIGAKIPQIYFLLIFAATIGLYNFHRLVKLYSGRYDVLTDFKAQIKQFQWLHFLLMGIGGSVSLWLFLRLEKTLIPFLLVPIVVAAFYSLPFLPVNGEKRALREIPGIKGIAVAGTWTFLTAIVPYFAFNPTPACPTVFPAFLWISEFISFYVITGLSDIRDLSIDPPHLKTVIQRLGISRTIRFFVTLLVAAIVLSGIACIRDRINLSQFMGLASGNILLIGLALKSKNRQPSWFYTILVDGVLIVQWFIFATLQFIS